MKKIVILLSVMLFMVACEKGNEEMKEAKVVVSVYDENGKIATGVPVKMYNEKDYKIFEVGFTEQFNIGWRIFGVDVDGRNTENLPQNTKLQKGFVEYINKGGKFGSGKGMLFFDGENLCD